MCFCCSLVQINFTLVQPYYLYSTIGEILKIMGKLHVDGLVQYCSISIANALDILQSCTKLSIYDKAETKPSKAVYFLRDYCTWNNLAIQRQHSFV